MLKLFLVQLSRWAIEIHKWRKEEFLRCLGVLKVISDFLEEKMSLDFQGNVLSACGGLGA